MKRHRYEKRLVILRALLFYGLSQWINDNHTKWHTNLEAKINRKFVPFEKIIDSFESGSYDLGIIKSRLIVILDISFFEIPGNSDFVKDFMTMTFISHLNPYKVSSSSVCFTQYGFPLSDHSIGDKALRDTTLISFRDDYFNEDIIDFYSDWRSKYFYKEEFLSEIFEQIKKAMISKLHKYIEIF
jgi:hypothetical protein